ncbi:hypothetical protein G3N55_09110 [Dissulfurirhabdus thermomarina]|uniref:Uncharacterized protein n=1 Tax=Dissulfurirhabdus thermomarina TaxID=1765737 RepID=A0A6N9TPM5_DISTH|nr:AsmA-like C-terminal domain-containing protein [Dissulfurirhabdus thermomarina]NDY42998.1 hypothetical protein [Dissulfurirhabdus thermomarina]NMX23656.1 hypothetical protein [Dissulfurirhabdus thermomarina]
MRPRRLRRLLPALVLPLALVVWLGPYLVGLEAVRARVLQAARARLGPATRLAAIRWSWLPRPAVTLSGVHIELPGLVLDAPAVELVPDPIGLAHGRPALWEVRLASPSARIEPAAWHRPGSPAHAEPAGARFVPPPIRRVRVTEGRIVLRDGPRRIDLTGVEARIGLSERPLTLEVTCTPGLADRLEVHGTLEPGTLRYRLRVALKGLRPASAVGAWGLRHPLAPRDLVLNLQGDVSGDGTGAFEGRFTGDIPCLVLRPGEEDISFACGALAFQVVRDGDAWTVGLDRLDLSDPRLRISGRIRYLAETGGARRSRLALDLRAADVDLGGVRRKVLALWGGHPVARKVCDIVRGGTATAAGFSFEGPPSWLNRLDKMRITATVRGTEVHVPGLSLTDTAGEVRIVDGLLVGENLSTRLDHTFGHDGTLRLGLHGADPAFHLDIAVDVDMADLVPVLRGIVHGDALRSELDRFRDLSGRAEGRLRIGERLHAPKVRVDVSAMDFSGRYARLPWPFTVRRGRLALRPEKVTWTGIEAEVGPHRLREVAGSITLGRRQDLRMEGAGEISAGPLLAGLSAVPAAARALSPFLAHARGRITVSRFTLAGPWSRPAAWRYEAEATALDLRLDGPALPAGLRLRRVDLLVNQERVTLRRAEADVKGLPLSAAGSVRFGGPKAARGGWLDVEGAMGRTLAMWLEGRGWLPAAYRPRLPCRIENAHLAWDAAGARFSGDLFPGRRGGAATDRVAVRLSVTPGHLRIERLSLESRGEKGELSLDLDRRRGGLRLAWAGAIRKTSLDRLLSRNRLLSGEMDGNFTLAFDPDRPGRTRVTGRARVRHLRWPWGLRRPVDVEQLKVSGHGGSARLDVLILGIGPERVHLKGDIRATRAALVLDLEAASPRLTWENLASFLPAAGEKKGGTPPSGRRRWPVDLELRFRVKAFRVAEKTLERASTSGHVFTVRRAVGKIGLTPAGDLHLRVTRAELCGLGLGLRWDTHGAETRMDLNATAAALPFETALPCLGRPQRLISGRADLALELSGRPGTWTGGRLVLRSDGGRIHKFTLISKLFSLLNVIELFKGHLPDLTTEGFGYSRMDIQGTVADNRLTLTRAAVKGEGMDLFATGDIRLDGPTLDLMLLVAPLKSVDAVVKKVPLLGYVLAGERGTLVTIAFRVRGPAGDPKISPLPAEALGKGVLGILGRAVGLPLHILKPVLGGGEDDRPAPVDAPRKGR